MKQYRVFTYIVTQLGTVLMRHVHTLTARTPEDALRIAKQKGYVAPCVGEASCG